MTTKKKKIPPAFAKRAAAAKAMTPAQRAAWAENMRKARAAAAKKRGGSFKAKAKAAKANPSAAAKKNPPKKLPGTASALQQWADMKADHAQAIKEGDYEGAAKLRASAKRRGFNPIDGLRIGQTIAGYTIHGMKPAKRGTISPKPTGLMQVSHRSKPSVLRAMSVDALYKKAAQEAAAPAKKNPPKRKAPSRATKAIQHVKRKAAARKAKANPPVRINGVRIVWSGQTWHYSITHTYGSDGGTLTGTRRVSLETLIARLSKNHGLPAPALKATGYKAHKDGDALGWKWSARK